MSRLVSDNSIDDRSVAGCLKVPHKVLEFDRAKERRRRLGFRLVPSVLEGQGQVWLDLIRMARRLVH